LAYGLFKIFIFFHVYYVIKEFVYEKKAKKKNSFKKKKLLLLLILLQLQDINHGVISKHINKYIYIQI